MEGPNYLILDIETCPTNRGGYEQLSEEEQKKLLNPIDSRITAIGIRFGEKNTIIMEEDEKVLLEKFWETWKEIKKPHVSVVGFNIATFDIPFIVTRSFIHNVKIQHFVVKEIIDVREKVNAYRFGPTRGTLKDYGSILGMESLEMDGSHAVEAFMKKDVEKLVQYLKNDLSITEAMYKRLKDTKILYITKW